MANSSLNLTSLDFNTLKDEYKAYLKSQTIFKDYNFEGSNMNVLLDVMSYNSYLNAFYLNMVASEMFLDSAQKLDSVVSHAKELNYLPKSAKSSTASLSFNVTTGSNVNPFTIPKNTLFSGTNANGAFTFVTNQAHTYNSMSNVYSINDLSVYEGSYTQDSFVFDNTSPTQRFVLTNSTIDLDSLKLTIYENNGLNVTEYTKVETLFNLTSTSAIYFVQAAQNGQYEIVFGDGTLGLLPQNGAVIVAEYRITMGQAGNGINNLVCSQDLGPMNGTTSSIDTIVIALPSNNGAPAEDIESIRKFAPRYFATQQRAVSSDDYSSLIYNKFGGLIGDVNVYGGETQEPKLYGRVIIAIKPAGGLIAPNYLKNDISNYLTAYAGIPTRVKITDPDYLYCGIKTTVQYNKNITTKTANEIDGTVVNAIKQFSTNNLEKFGNDFRYSKFVYHIDDSDSSITSNDTGVTIIKRISPTLNYATTYALDFNNSTEIEPTAPGYTKGAPFYDEPALTSSAFTFVSVDGSEYPNSYIRDNNYGILVVYTTINGVFTILDGAAGTIEYTTGKVTLTKFKTAGYVSYISIYMAPQNKDIIADKDKIIIIDPNDVIVNVIEIVK